MNLEVEFPISISYKVNLGALTSLPPKKKPGGVRVPDPGGPGSGLAKGSARAGGALRRNFAASRAGRMPLGAAFVSRFLGHRGIDDIRRSCKAFGNQAAIQLDCIIFEPLAASVEKFKVNIRVLLDDA